MSDTDPILTSRRRALRCLAFGGAGTLFTLAGGVLTPMDLVLAGTDRKSVAAAGVPLFVQISDTHIGFNKEANPDVPGTLRQTIELVNAMPARVSRPDIQASATMPVMMVAEASTIPI